MCQSCQRLALGSVYCEEHLPAAAAPPQPPPIPESARPAGYAGSPYSAPFSAAPHASPYTAPMPPAVAPDPSAHPALALILGFVPGVGAIYNGQYAKGLIHAVIFGLLVSVEIASRGSMAAFVGIMIAIWVVYQAFESYHTARQRRYGIAVEEFSSLIDIRPVHGRFPIGAVVLIGLGFILLLDTTDIISMDQFERYWPVLLIGVGLYMLYMRLNPAAENHRNGTVNGEARR